MSLASLTNYVLVPTCSSVCWKVGGHKSCGNQPSFLSLPSLFITWLVFHMFSHLFCRNMIVWNWLLLAWRYLCRTPYVWFSWRPPEIFTVQLCFWETLPLNPAQSYGQMLRYLHSAWIFFHTGESLWHRTFIAAEMRLVHLSIIKSSLPSGGSASPTFFCYF